MSISNIIFNLLEDLIFKNNSQLSIYQSKFFAKNLGKKTLMPDMVQYASDIKMKVLPLQDCFMNNTYCHQTLLQYASIVGSTVTSTAEFAAIAITGNRSIVIP